MCAHCVCFTQGVLSTWETGRAAHRCRSWGLRDGTPSAALPSARDHCVRGSKRVAYPCLASKRSCLGSLPLECEVILECLVDCSHHPNTFIFVFSDAE